MSAFVNISQSAPSEFSYRICSRSVKRGSGRRGVEEFKYRALKVCFDLLIKKQEQRESEKHITQTRKWKKDDYIESCERETRQTSLHISRYNPNLAGESSTVRLMALARLNLSNRCTKVTIK